MSFRLPGSYRHRESKLWDLACASTAVAVHREAGRSAREACSWRFEAASLVSRYRMPRALSLNTVAEARELIDSIRFDSPPPRRISVHDSTLTDVKGVWIEPANRQVARTVLYFHGGGHGFFAQAPTSLIGQIACTAHAHTLRSTKGWHGLRRGGTPFGQFAQLADTGVSQHLLQCRRRRSRHKIEATDTDAAPLKSQMP